jgi:hypothetical protein
VPTCSDQPHGKRTISAWLASPAQDPFIGQKHVVALDGRWLAHRFAIPHST